MSKSIDPFKHEMRDALGKEDVCASYKVSGVVKKDDMCQPKPEFPIGPGAATFICKVPSFQLFTMIYALYLRQ
jgi:hypothetical protein